MEFSSKEYWSGLPFPAPGDLPDPGLKLTSPAWQADSLPQALPGMPKVNYRDKVSLFVLLLLLFYFLNLYTLAMVWYFPFHVEQQWDSLIKPANLM